MITHQVKLVAVVINITQAAAFIIAAQHRCSTEHLMGGSVTKPEPVAMSDAELKTFKMEASAQVEL